MWQLFDVKWTRRNALRNGTEISNPQINNNVPKNLEGSDVSTHTNITLTELKSINSSFFKIAQVNSVSLNK
jgi:hypothetical protein